jgi:hypothetical protein
MLCQGLNNCKQGSCCEREVVEAGGKTTAFGTRCRESGHCVRKWTDGRQVEELSRDETEQTKDQDTVDGAETGSLVVWRGGRGCGEPPHSM